MKKILLVTEVFPPAFNPRMGYLVKYLTDFGLEADIITNNIVKNNNYISLVGNNKIVRVNLRHRGIPRGFSQNISYLLNLKRHYLSYKNQFLDDLRLNFKKDDYSLIFVSLAWNDLFVLEVGYKISKEWGIPIIADFRDIHEQKPDIINSKRKSGKALLVNFLVRSFVKSKIKIRNKILNNIEAVTTVSPFHVEQLSKYNNKVQLIYNGYDPELFKPDNIEKTDTFSIIYTGIVVDQNEQDPTLLFEAVLKLTEDKIINETFFRIQFYTPDNYRVPILKHRLFTLVEKYIDFFDYVDYQKVPALLARSSIALVLTNLSTSTGPKGVLTTKFFDYIGAERPVLCVRSDEGVLEDTIIKTNIGVAAKTVNEVYSFISEKLIEWRDKGFTTVKVNQEFKKQFSRKAQASQFVDIFKRFLGIIIASERILEVITSQSELFSF